MEPLILYLVFFSPSLFFAPAGPAAFSAGRVLAGIFTHNLPSLALIGYLLRLRKTPGEAGFTPPRLRDLKSALIALPGLVIAGFAVSLVPSFFREGPVRPMAEAPGGPVQWLVTIGACVSTGYFEEGFFRLYLLTRFRETGISAARGICISTLLFALCHVYEGPGGVLNAALAGIVLSLVFTREGSLHGLAWAHGAYNILVYATIRLFP